MGFMMLEGTPDGENILKAVEKGSEPSAWHFVCQKLFRKRQPPTFLKL